MSAVEFDKIYEQTETYILSLKNTFLDKHLSNPLAAPEDYDLDVKSFCILSHSAFEDYFETISLKVMHFCINDYIMNKKTSETIISLLHFKSSGITYFSKFKKDEDTLINIRDYTREKLSEIKKQFSIEVNDNHGASLMYIRQLLMPVAIDIPNDVNILNSLRLLAKERGFYAHKFLDGETMKKSIEPEKAKNIVEDCLKLCLDIRDKAKVRIS